jgi:hypothetical protein
MPENSCSIRFLYGDQARFFDDEIRPELRHSKTGTVAMASAGENCLAVLLMIFDISFSEYHCLF